MNAANSLRGLTQFVARRAASNAAAGLPKQPIPDVYAKRTFQKNFLSDPSTYPLLAIMSAACCLMVGMGSNALLYYKGLRITPAHKRETINTWDGAKVGTVTEVITRNPIAFHRQGFKDIRYEGLGVNHEEWKQSKQKA